MPPTPARLLLAVVSITVLAGHVAPSVDDNNRYLKVTALGDGARLAYTVFYGEIPGASERRRIDENRDGRIDPGESGRFGDRLAAQIAAALVVEADGTPHPVRWHSVSVGLGTEQTIGGSFSIDLVAYVCLRGSGARHRVRVRDEFRIPRPGETEVRVEGSPGVTVHRARIGALDDPSHEYRFAGPGGALSDDGLEIELSARPDAARVPGGLCGATRPAHGGDVPWLPVALGALVAAGAIAAVIRRRRAR